VLIGAALVIAALIGGIVLLVAGGDDNDNNGSSTSSNPDLAQLQNQFLKKTVTIADKGISVRRPSDWTDRKSAGALTLQSPDHCVQLTLSAPAPADQYKKVHDDSIALFKKSFKNVKVAGAGTKEVGGLPTRTNTLSFTQNGKRLSVIFSVGKGEKYTYLTEIAVGNPACQGDLQRGRLVVSSIQYTK
jgi:hypothetical protein